METMTHEIAAWCERHLGSRPDAELFHVGHLYEVVGLVLVDGRAVVIKIRPGSSRLAATAAIQRHFHNHGFPCPNVLAGPSPLGKHVRRPRRMCRTSAVLQSGSQ